MSDTAKSWTIDKAPKRIKLLGDKTKPESAQHIIEFPGGAVELSRTMSGDYWAHIIVNRTDFDGNDGQGLNSARGVVVDARIDREHPDGVVGIEKHERIEQVAVLIRASGWCSMRALLAALEQRLLLGGARPLPLGQFGGDALLRCRRSRIGGRRFRLNWRDLDVRRGRDRHGHAGSNRTSRGPAVAEHRPGAGLAAALVLFSTHLRVPAVAALASVEDLHALPLALQAVGGVRDDHRHALPAARQPNHHRHDHDHHESSHATHDTARAPARQRRGAW